MDGYIKGNQTINPDNERFKPQSIVYKADNEGIYKIKDINSYIYRTVPQILVYPTLIKGFVD